MAKFRENGFGEMGTCLAVQQEIDRGQIPLSALAGFSISEVLSALESEHAESKILEYF